MLNLKAISPVIATALLLVVAVVSVTLFQTFFGTFSNGLFSKVETQEEINVLSAEGIYADTLYLNSESSTNLILLKIIDINGNLKCQFQDNVQNILQTDTRFLLTFNNATFNGTHAIDLSGYNNTLIVNASFTSENCISSDCFEFNGVNNRLSILNNTSLNFTSSNKISISLWAKSPIWRPTASWRALIDKSAYGLYVHPASDQIRFQIATNNGVRTVDTATVLQTNVWYNFVGTWDGNNICVYQNGVLKDCNVYSGETISSNSVTGYIGYYSGAYFNGTIDEVAIYSKALTSDEINSLYLGRKAKFYEQILIDGIKEIDISNCNLNSGEYYNVVAFTNINRVEQKVLVK